MSHIRSTPYCLACYASLPAHTGASQPCPRCGEINIQADRTLFWSRERKLRRIEGAAKLAIVVLIAGLYFLGIHDFRASGAAAGWAAVFPLIALGMLLWQTASLLTRKPRYLNVRLTWTLVFTLFPVVPALLFVPFALSTDGMAWGIVLGLALLGALVALPFLWLGRLVWRSGPRLERWKRERVERGRELAEAELAAQ